MDIDHHVRGIAMNPVDHPHGWWTWKDITLVELLLAPYGKLTKGSKNGN